MNIRFLTDLLEMCINAYYNTIEDNLVYKYGYEGNTVMCKLFSYQDKLVLAIKGTTIDLIGSDVGNNDKLMVNTLFKECTEKDDICEYNKKIVIDKMGYLTDLKRIVNSIRYLYPGTQIILTGHSLGGALASLLASMTGLESISFSSPGESYIRTVLGINKNINERIFHLGMCNDIIYTGKCTILCNTFGYNLNTKVHQGEAYCIRINNSIDNIIFHKSYVLLKYLKDIQMNEYYDS